MVSPLFGPVCLASICIRRSRWVGIPSDGTFKLQAAERRRKQLQELAVEGGIYTKGTKFTKKDLKFMDDVDRLLARTVAKVEKNLETEVRAHPSGGPCAHVDAVSKALAFTKRVCCVWDL